MNDSNLSQIMQMNYFYQMYNLMSHEQRNSIANVLTPPIYNAYNINNLEKNVEKCIIKERKLSNLTPEEESIYMDKLKTIFKNVEVNDVMMKLLSKLHLKTPSISMEESDSKEEKWKCTVCLGFGGSNKFQGVGYHNNKKKAKKFATEQMILCILNSKQYGNKVKNFIEDFLIKITTNDEEVKVDSVIGEEDLKYFKDYKSSDKSTLKLSKEKTEQHLNSNSNITNITNNKEINSQINPQINTSLNTQSTPTLPHIPIDKVFKLNKIKQNLKETEGEILNVLNFEIFMTKWERSVMVEIQYIVINNILEITHKNLARMFKKQIPGAFVNISEVGSYKDNTMRGNFIGVDLIVEYADNLNKDGIIERSYNCLSEVKEFKEEEFRILYNKSHDENKYITVTNKERTISFNLYFHTTSSPLLKSISKHDKWKELKCSIELEDTILIKFLKTWRRGKGLHELSTLLLESIVLKFSGKGSLYEKIIRVFNCILDIVVNKQSSHNELEKYQLELIRLFIEKVSDEEMIRIKSECEEGIKNIKEGKYADLF